MEPSEQELLALLRTALEPAFVIVRRLGAGGMGIVYLARDPALKRLVAVKVMAPDRAADPDARARFQREAEAVAAISHPNVVAVHSVGTLSNGIPYLVMQYVDGPTLSERLLTEGPMDLETTRQVLGQVASALEAAHRKGIIHRDIKPANILWDDVGGRAVVSDFGIAAILEPDFDERSSRLTHTGIVVGTPRYMSPEQLLAEPVTERSDIYSLGLLGYEMLTCEGPFQVSSPNQLIAAHLRDAPRPLSATRADVDPVLESILMSCLEKDAFGRPTAEEVARRLQHGSSILLEWPPPGLEDLHGAAARPLSRLILGSLSIAAPLTFMVVTSRESGLRPGLPGIMLLPAIAAMGALAVAFGLMEAEKILRTSIRAARAGYGWGIIAEVLVDVTKDTGTLITGEREYAVLPVAVRSRIRRWRVLRGVLGFSAALCGVAGLLAGIPIAARLGGSRAMLALWTLGIPAGLLITSQVLEWRERRLLDPIRSRIRKQRSTIEKLSHLAQTWRDGFDRIVPGMARGHGAFGRVARRIAAVATLATLATAGALTSAALMAVSVGRESNQAMAMLNARSLQERVNGIKRLQVLRPPVDPAITPERAGYALQSIGNAGRKPGGGEAPVRFPIDRPIAMPKAPDPFPGTFLKGNAIRQARTGLSPAQRAWLEELAANPGAPEFSLVARSALPDWMGVALKPMPENTIWPEIPIPRFGPVRIAGYANVARAALAVADRRPADAERFLRENVGVGFALLEGPTWIENMVGVTLVQVGRDALVAVYEAAGRQAEARAISAGLDPGREEVPELLQLTPSPGERERYRQGVIRDPGTARGIRWEFAVAQLAYEPCNDLGQILFGPDPIHETRLAEARRLLVRTPGEDHLMRVAERALQNPVSPAELGMPVSLGWRTLTAFAKSVDALTGSKRMQACATVLPLY